MPRVKLFNKDEVHMIPSNLFEQALALYCTQNIKLTREFL